MLDALRRRLFPQIPLLKMLDAGASRSESILNGTLPCSANPTVGAFSIAKLAACRDGLEGCSPFVLTVGVMLDARASSIAQLAALPSRVGLEKMLEARSTPSIAISHIILRAHTFVCVRQLIDRKGPVWTACVAKLAALSRLGAECSSSVASSTKRLTAAVYSQLQLRWRCWVQVCFEITASQNAYFHKT